MIKIKTAESSAVTTEAARVRKALLKEIGARWKKLSETELSGLHSKDDVVAKVAALYELEKPVALKQVDEVLKGRRI